MKIVIAGVGAIGGYFGGLMADAPEDNEIVFYCRGKNLDAIRNNGLTIIDGNSRSVVHPAAASDDPSVMTEADAILICTKSYGLDEMLPCIEPHTPDGVLVVPLLNGIDPTERTAAFMPRAVVLKGCAYIFATLTEPGVVNRVWKMRKIVFGPASGEPETAFRTANALCAFMARCGIDSTITDDIDFEIWKKFALLSPNAALTSLYGRANRDIATNRLTRPLLAEMVREVCAVARANGVKLPLDTPDKIVAAGENSPEGATTSMSVDVQNGRHTEMESLVGYICREGKRLGVEVPTYDEVYDGLIAKGVRYS